MSRFSSLETVLIHLHVPKCTFFRTNNIIADLHCSRLNGFTKLICIFKTKAYFIWYRFENSGHFQCTINSLQLECTLSNVVGVVFVYLTKEIVWVTQRIIVCYNEWIVLPSKSFLPWVVFIRLLFACKRHTIEYSSNGNVVS